MRNALGTVFVKRHVSISATKKNQSEIKRSVGVQPSMHIKIRRVLLIDTSNSAVGGGRSISTFTDIATREEQQSFSKDCSKTNPSKIISFKSTTARFNSSLLANTKFGRTTSQENYRYGYQQCTSSCSPLPPDQDDG
jgi:hypothetical protein